MFMRFALLACLSAVAGCGAGTTSDASDGKITVCLLPKIKGISYFSSCHDGAVEAAQELGDVELIYDGPTDGDPTKQAEMIEQWIVDGVDVICVDSDGKVDLLIPLWLEAGLNCIFPVEVGTWQADPIQYRQQYGQALRMMGGFNKHLLARSKSEIEREVHRLAPLVEEGGYIGFCDHRVPPDVPLDNYMFYLETVRKVWARNVDLKPMGRLT